MQTITPSWTASTDDQKMIAGWQRDWAGLIRTSYANAEGRNDKVLRDFLKARFPDFPLGSWAIHCAALDGIRLRKAVPDGKMVFGGREFLERRRKNLITAEEWRDRRRHRAIEITGDRTRWGNRHFHLSEDGLRCEVEFLGVSVTLHLSGMSGKDGKLVRAVAKLAAAGEISVHFALGRTHLSITFNEMDLRKLPLGETLESVKKAELATSGKKPRGRPRKDEATHYAAHRIKPIPSANRPVHPEWRDAVPVVSNRAIGLDLNPEWVGITVVQIEGDARNTDNLRILDYHLHRIAIPIDAPHEQMQQVMACIARDVVSLARAWNVGQVYHEDGLGKLAWSKKSRGPKALQTVNYWSRNALLGGLTRRCKLSGLTFSPIWGGYSTTIGNMCFDLPDACAAAAEIARRGLAVSTGLKDRFPVVPVQVASRRWKDETLPTALAKALASADDWQAVHRAVKSAKTIGYRRLHPDPKDLVPGRPLRFEGMGYAVNRLGNGKGACCSARADSISRTVRNSSDRVTIGAS